MISVSKRYECKRYIYIVYVRETTQGKILNMLTEIFKITETLGTKAFVGERFYLLIVIRLVIDLIAIDFS